MVDTSNPYSPTHFLYVEISYRELFIYLTEQTPIYIYQIQDLPQAIHFVRFLLSSL